MLVRGIYISQDEIDYFHETLLIKSEYIAKGKFYFTGWGLVEKNVRELKMKAASTFLRFV